MMHVLQSVNFGGLFGSGVIDLMCQFYWAVGFMCLREMLQINKDASNWGILVSLE
jgi:hypothetical protein